MSIGDLTELSLFAGLVALLLLLVFGAFRLRPAKVRGLSGRQKLRQFGRYVLVRLPIALAFALAIFVLGAAALTLNSHRPPADNDPVIRVPPGTRTAVVTVDLPDCGQPVEGRLRLEGVRGLAAGPARFYSDGSGWQRLELNSARKRAYAQFHQETPTQKRSLLSCYLQLPVVTGASRGYEVHLNLNAEMEVDRNSSVPAPGSYSTGSWIWRCGEGRKCPAFAAINYSVEDGAKQVIVLVLASIFGALIALLVGEVLIKFARSKFSKD